MDQHIQEHLAKREFAALAHKLEDHELDCAAALPQPLSFKHAPLLMACYVAENDLNNARFLWKRSESSLHKNGEFAALWEIVKALWKHDFSGAIKATNSFAWSTYTGIAVEHAAATLRADLVALIGNAFSEISVADLQAFLLISAGEVQQLAAEQDWKVEGDMVQAKPTVDSKNRKTSLQQLRQLTDYIVSLDS